MQNQSDTRKMENIFKGVQQAEAKKVNLQKLLEQIQSQSSSVLSFSMNWRDLEIHFESLQSSITKHIEELKERAKFVESSQRTLTIFQRSLETRYQALEKEKNDLDWAFKKNEELEAKERQLVMFEQSMEERLRDLVSRENQVRELEDKKREIFRLHEALEERAKQVERNVNYANMKENLIEQRAKELDEKQNQIMEREKVVEKREEKVSSAQKIILKQVEELTEKKKIVEEKKSLPESTQKSTGREELGLERTRIKIKKEMVEPEAIDYVLALPCQNLPSDHGKVEK